MEFLQPASLEEALSLFAERPAYTILAGGTDVVVHRRAGKLMPEGYLDVTRVPELREIRGGRTVFVGAAVTCGTLEHDPVIRAACPYWLLRRLQSVLLRSAAALHWAAM